MSPIRRIVTALAIACFAGAVALTPSEVRSRLGTGSAPDDVPTIAARAPIAVVVPDGDPFVARVADDDERPTPAGGAPLPLALARIGPLPPNAGALAMPPGWIGAGVPVVRAIVTGRHPCALVDDGSITRLVRAGDRLGATSVIAIDARGVTLGDGRRLALAANDAAQP